MMLFVLALILNTYFSLLTPVYSTIFCNQEYQCAGRDDSSMPVNESFRCQGHASCINSLALVSRVNVLCSGSFSCWDSRIINSDVACQGLFSCGLVDEIIGGVVSCTGEQSCFGANIYTSNTGCLTCEGTRGCRESRVFVGSSKDSCTVEISGDLGAQNAIFYSNATNTSFVFSGTDSGYGAKIICNDGHTCDVRCAGSGCNNLELLCGEDGNGNCVFNVDCNNGGSGSVSSDWAEKSDICPNGLDLDRIFNITGEDLYFRSLAGLTTSTYENSWIICNESKTNALECDNHRSCRDTYIDRD